MDPNIKSSQRLAKMDSIQRLIHAREEEISNY